MNVPSIALVLLVVMALVGWMAAVAGVALWAGERGRRLLAEKLLLPPEQQGEVAPVSRAPNKEAEDRFLAEVAAAEEQTVKRIAEGLLEQAHARLAQGDTTLEGYSEEQALEDAKRMYHGLDVAA